MNGLLLPMHSNSGNASGKRPSQRGVSSKTESKISPEFSGRPQVSWKDPPTSQKESLTSSSDKGTPLLGQDPQTEQRHEEVLQLAHDALTEAGASISVAKGKIEKLLEAADKKYAERMGKDK